ncbi:unnamed protein product [Mesocestoides corti]|uniref:Uncharacterized protein n=1 Tax=Mesocestoides corti TaxID=53468 RepID=A0A0R3U3W3_MESCO|nr:unnamed protein product [Mesocestoides corti]
MQPEAKDKPGEPTGRNDSDINIQESPHSEILSPQGESNKCDRPNRFVRRFKVFGPIRRQSSHETNSCPIIDDRSNSASPTRRQPHPAGMRTFRGFGQPIGIDERILEWPPPEPRPLLYRPIMPQFGLMLGGLPQPPHNPNVWVFGPTANVQQVMFDDGAEVIEAEDGRENLNEQSSPQISHGQGSALHRTTSEVSVNVDPLSFEIDDGLREEATPMILQTGGASSSLAASFSGLHPVESSEPDNLRPPVDELFIEQAPGVSLTPSNEEAYGTVRVQQANIEPPPRPIFFVIVDTNEGGPADDEQQATQFHFALVQLLAQLESASEDESLL